MSPHACVRLPFRRVAALPPQVAAIPSSLLASPAWLRALRAQRCASYSRAREDLSAPEIVARQLASAAPSCFDLGAEDDWTARLTDRDDLADAERRILASIYKPTDGIPARFNRRFSIPVSLALIRWTNVSANAMSILVILLGLYAGWLFSIGSYGVGVAAAVISLVASVLDGCDGELARLRYTDSAFGCWLDTFGDYSYYLAVFTGLTVGSMRQTGSVAFWWIGAGLLAGSLLTFALLIVLRGRITDGQPERLRGKAQEHFARGGKRWMRLVLSLSTCATRATMPYGILAFALAGALPVVVVLGAIGAHIYWISLALELRRLLAGTSVSSGSSGALHAEPRT